jgi:hypothetical protein
MSVFILFVHKLQRPEAVRLKQAKTRLPTAWLALMAQTTSAGLWAKSSMT